MVMGIRSKMSGRAPPYFFLIIFFFYSIDFFKKYIF